MSGYMCQFCALDEHFGGRSLQPRLIKIDVEGYGAGVLDGAWQTLASVRPIHVDRPLEPVTLDDVTGELANYWAVPD